MAEEMQANLREALRRQAIWLQTQQYLRIYERLRETASSIGHRPRFIY